VCVLMCLYCSKRHVFASRIPKTVENVTINENVDGRDVGRSIFEVSYQWHGSVERGTRPGLTRIQMTVFWDVPLCSLVEVY
jgi:hypothetical protein